MKAALYILESIGWIVAEIRRALDIYPLDKAWPICDHGQTGA